MFLSFHSTITVDLTASTDFTVARCTRPGLHIKFVNDTQRYYLEGESCNKNQQLTITAADLYRESNKKSGQAGLHFNSFSVTEK